MHLPLKLKVKVKLLKLTLNRSKNVRFLTLEGWHGAHCVGLLELPQIMVRHLKIGPYILLTSFVRLGRVRSG